MAEPQGKVPNATFLFCCDKKESCSHGGNDYLLNEKNIVKSTIFSEKRLTLWGVYGIIYIVVRETPHNIFLKGWYFKWKQTL